MKHISLISRFIYSQQIIPAPGIRLIPMSADLFGFASKLLDLIALAQEPGTRKNFQIKKHPLLFLGDNPFWSIEYLQYANVKVPWVGNEILAARQQNTCSVYNYYGLHMLQQQGTMTMWPYTQTQWNSN